jgi:hypothetical protein
MTADATLAPPCPNCSGPGLARVIEVNDGLRTIQYKCQTCDHVWAISSPAPEPSWTWNGVSISPGCSESS